MKTVTFEGPPEVGPVTFQVTSIFEKNRNSQKRVTVNRGGTRSSKTYSLAQLFIMELFTGEGKTLSIVRKTFAALRDTVMRDVLEILEEHGLYEYVKHNKTERTIKYGSNMIEFMGIHNANRVRGRKRTHLWVNEATDCIYDDWQQLIFRTTGKAYLDFNPDDINHWLNTELEQKRNDGKCDVEVIVSSFKDNDFLGEETIKEIEYLGQSDPEYWKVFGMGEYGRTQGLIFPNNEVVEEIPEEAKLVAYGLDFGYSNSATALVEVWRQGDDLYFRELLYATMMTNSDIIGRLRELNINRGTEIISDSADPKAIEEIYRAGYNAKACKKGGDSVRFSIDILKRYKRHIAADSVNLQKEMRSYRWRTDRNGNTVEQPVNRLNHAIDALRYVALEHLQADREVKYHIV